MRAWLALLLCLFSAPALAQGYLNPPIYATGVVLVQPGTTVTTVLRQAYSPNNLTAYAAGPISTWTIVLPHPAFDGQIISIGCPGGAVTSLLVQSPDTLPSLPSSCFLGQFLVLQFYQGAWILTSNGIAILPAFSGDVASTFGSTTLSIQPSAGYKLTGSESGALRGMISDCYLGPASFGSGGTGACTDNHTALVALNTAAQASRQNIFVPCGDYYVSSGITIANVSDTTNLTYRPSLTFSGARCVHFYFGPGAYNPVTYAGTNAQSTGAVSMQDLGGFTATKHDFQGDCVVIQGMAHIVARNIFASGCQIGFAFIDVQESQFFNLYGVGNALLGLQASKGSFTDPNALDFYGSSFVLNGLGGADFQNGYANILHGGSVEQNGFAGGGGFGVRLLYNDSTDVDGGIAATLDTIYFERNMGAADVQYVNGISGATKIPSMVRLVGDNFNRAPNSQGAVVSISNANPSVVGFINHGFSAGQPVQFSSTGTMPAGITSSQTYYVIAAGFTANTFEFSATVGGSAIATTSAGTGTFTVTSWTTNVVRISTSNSNPVTIVSSSSYGLKNSGYTPSTTTPYFGIDDSTQPIKFCDLGSRYTDYQEAPNFFQSCDFFDIQLDEGASTTVRRSNNLLSFTRNGTGDYTFTTAYPGMLKPDGSGPAAYNIQATSNSTAGYALIASYTTTTIRLQFFNLGNTPTDAQNLSVRVLN